MTAPAATLRDFSDLAARYDQFHQRVREARAALNDPLPDSMPDQDGVRESQQRELGAATDALGIFLRNALESIASCTPSLMRSLDDELLRLRGAPPRLVQPDSDDRDSTDLYDDVYSGEPIR